MDAQQINKLAATVYRGGMISRAGSALRALSLDVAAGGVCGSALAASLTQARLPWTAWPVLAAAIWVVYTLDHLSDAQRLNAQDAAPRHRVHAAHAKATLVCATIVGCAAAVVAVATLPPAVCAAGAALAVLSLAHLANAQRERPVLLPKELSAAAIYTAGVWCAPLLAADHVDAWAWTALSVFFAAASSNLLLNALIEIPSDAKRRFSSAALSWGGRNTARAILALAFAGAGASAGALVFGPPHLRPAFSVLALLAAAPAVLLWQRERVEARERYRLFGDLAFLLAVLPAVLPR